MQKLELKVDDDLKYHGGHLIYEFMLALRIVSIQKEYNIWNSKMCGTVYKILLELQVNG